MTKFALTLIFGCFASFLADAADPAYDRVDAKVSMSDNVHLDASLYIPKNPANAHLPLIVRQHGGGSNKDSPFDLMYGLKAVETGHFALLMYSVRGHGNSEGLFDFFGPRSTQDLSEMLDWVAATYSNLVDTNNVGLTGYSQGGGESLLPAEHDARVKALAVGNTFADLNYALNPNDCYKISFATGIFFGAYTASASKVDLALAARWGAQLMTDTEDLGTPVVPSTTDDLASRSPQTHIDVLVARKVPVFWTNGWEDQLFPGDHPERILSVLEANGIPVHYWFASGGHAAGPNFPAEETQREQAMLDWFEQFLNGSDRGYSNKQKVDFWQRVSGTPRIAGEWEHFTAAAWPIPDVITMSLYPRGNGSLDGNPALSSETATLANDYVSANVANDALILELAKNAPGLGDILAKVPESENPIDTITYTSAILKEPLNVVGAPEITVAQDSIRVLTQQLDAKVWDVSPAGAQLIWRGAVSGLLGTKVSFKLWPNAHRFDPGHQIILKISSVDFPTFKPDSEPWRASILLSGTRMDLPVTTSSSITAISKQASAASSSSGGAMPSPMVLIVLLFWRWLRAGKNESA